MQQSLFNGASTFKNLWYYFGTSLASTTYQLGELPWSCLEIRQHGTQIKSSSSYLFWVVFNRIESSEFTEVILCMDGDVTPEEYPKPYLDEVYGGRVIHFNTRQNLATAERVLLRLHVYHIWGSEIQDSGWIQPRLQSMLFISESLLCLYYNSVTWMTLCSSLAST
jgi:hypothetical protein